MNGKNEIELTILMPCLNEAETIVTCIDKAQCFLKNSGINAEVLIVDNGSTDGSIELARDAGARVVHAVEKGYGGALKQGIRDAKGKFVIMGDADDSYDFSSLDDFVRELRTGSHLVVGNRFAGGIAPGAMPPLHRYLGNPVLSAVGRVFFRSRIGDFHCGLRGFSRDAIHRLNLTSSGMEFASEMIVKATLRGLDIGEVPTTLSPDGRAGAPHLRSWRDGWRHLRFLLLLSPKWLFFYPGVLLLALGTLLIILTLAGPISIASTTFDIHTLTFGSAFVILGSQASMYSVLALTYYVRTGLIRRSAKLERFRDRFSLEAGLLIALLLLLSGGILGLLALGQWGATDFGPLDPVKSMRLVIPSTTLMILGLQAGLFSFFFSLMELPNIGLNSHTHRGLH